jgi:ABC-type Fe2+-enterobactin transport system substrate-binding protein
MKGGKRARTSRITIRQHKLTGLANKLISVPDSLVEQRRQADRESIGAITSHDLAWIRNVALLIGRGWIDTIPAAREHQLKTDAIDAVSIQICLVRKEVAIQGALGGLAVVETVEANGRLLQECLGVIWSNIPEGFLDIRNRVGKVALVCVASDHLEAGRKGG